jgi:aminoglycoside phosphotransferase (APT) family kinase protein
MVMDRLHGTSLLEWALPFRIGVAGRLLGRLHNQLHELHAPVVLERRAPVDGDRLLHGDLHALNVMVTEDGPMVIDWANAMVGDPSFDVADCWAVMACADTPEGTPTWLASVGRRLFLRSFLRATDPDGEAEAIRGLAARARARDPNMTTAERERLGRFGRVDRAVVERRTHGRSSPR